MEEKKERRGGARANTGGARPGAGRKRKTKDRLDIKLYGRFSESEEKEIKSKATSMSLSVSELIRMSVLEKINR